ncbi:MAG TPA: hypothetical protein DFK12_13985 [Gallionellaceae bacterium]|nr:hypothetical protein [Gallionellaceae bacterium]
MMARSFVRCHILRERFFMGRALYRQVWSALAGLAVLLSMAGAACAQDDYKTQDVYLETMRLIANGQRQEASDTLVRIIQDEPAHAGAWLDLAFLQCEMGYAEEAERLFAEIVTRFQPPPAILEIIAQRQAQGCAVVQSAGRMALMLGRGFDDNVNQGASSSYFTFGAGGSRIELQLLPEYLPKRDQFSVLSAEYAQNLNARGTTGFVQFQARSNDVLTRYDAALVSVGAEHPWRAGDWRMRGVGVLSALSLGGALYQKQQHLQVVASPHLPNGFEFDLSGGVTSVAYPTLSNFDATLWEMRGLLNYGTPLARVQATAGYSFDHALSARPGGNRRGWSASILGNGHLASNVFGELSWGRQTWLGESAYSPGLLDLARNQTMDILSASLLIPVAERQAVRVDLRQVTNRENISIFQYNNRQLLVSWQWRNF